MRLRTEIVQECRDCPFWYVDEYGGEICNVGGTPDSKYPDVQIDQEAPDRPADCPLEDGEITVKLNV